MYRKTEKQHIKILFRTLGNYQEARDVFHDAVCAAIRYYPTYDPKIGGIEPWFFSIVRNTLRKHLRNKKKSLNVLHSEYHENYEEDPLDKYLEILNSIKELGGDEYLVVHSYFIKGYEIKDICKATGLSERFVRSCNTLFKLGMKEEY